MDKYNGLQTKLPRYFPLFFFFSFDFEYAENEVTIHSVRDSEIERSHNMFVIATGVGDNSNLIEKPLLNTSSEIV